MQVTRRHRAAPGRGAPGLTWLTSSVTLAAVLAGCEAAPADGGTAAQAVARQSAPSARAEPGPHSARPDPTGPPRGRVTLGFAGDVHFEDQLAARLRRPGTALRPIADALRRPDLMMLNLETSLTRRGKPEPKEYTFRSPPSALDALDAAGVDVVSLGNNHGVDFGRVGLRDTLAAVREGPVPVVGIGEDATAAFRPHLTSVRGTDIAVLAASTKRDRTARAWAAGVGEPGVAVAVTPRQRLLRSVRAGAQRADVVVVYLHWGKEQQACPNRTQEPYARELSAAGADVVVGSHAHTLLGAGWLDDTYVDYGLGNFVWYNQRSVDTGILRLTVRRGHVVSDSFSPANVGVDGRPRLDRPGERAAAVASWRRLRGCTGLAPRPSR